VEPLPTIYMPTTHKIPIIKGRIVSACAENGAKSTARFLSPCRIQIIEKPSERKGRDTHANLILPNGVRQKTCVFQNMKTAHTFSQHANLVSQ